MPGRADDIRGGPDNVDLLRGVCGQLRGRHMTPKHEPMVLGILTGLAFLLVAVITYPYVQSGPPTAENERIAYRR